MHSASKGSAVRPSHINYHLKSEGSITLRYQLCSTLYKKVQIKKHLCNQSNHYENTDSFLYERKPSHDKLTCYTISNDEWNTKEATGTSIILPAALCQKTPLEVK